MNAFRMLTALLLAPLALAPAQEQATTLLAACRTADVVVCATVVRATDPSPDWHRLEFTVDRQLAGAPLAAFALLEPAGPCCGRSLFALLPGDRRLLFLRRVGATLHPFGGDRGVLPATPELEAHVQALLATTDAAATARLLAHALASTERRIGDDAAHALAVLPNLQLPSAERALVVQALTAAVDAKSTRAPALVDVAVRQQDPAVLDALLPLYLRTPASDHAELLRKGLVRCEATEVGQRLPLHLADDDTQRVRAAELLSHLPAHVAAAPLQQLLQGSPSPRVQLAAAEALLAAGTASARLAPDVPEPVLDLAARRQAARKRFRTIDPYRQ